jgi:hypothetical protein
MRKTFQAPKNSTKYIEISKLKRTSEYSIQYASSDYQNY